MNINANEPTPSSPFDITRRDPAGNAAARYPDSSVTLPAAGTTVGYRGFALGAGLNDVLDAADTFVPAEPTNFIGHLTRDVVVGGLSLADRVFGRTTPTPTGLAGPFTAGSEVTVEKAEEFEAEGANLIMISGARALDSTQPIGTRITFLEGKVALWLSGDHAFYTLTANGLPASDGTSLRVRCERI